MAKVVPHVSLESWIVGANVHYIDSDGEHYIAIIEKQNGSKVDLIVFNTSIPKTMLPKNVRFDMSGTVPNTWHWIEGRGEPEQMEDASTTVA